MIERPCTEEDLQKGEATGVVRASRLVRNYAQSHREINVSVILEIHKEIFKDIWLDIAGQYRTENLKINHLDKMDDYEPLVGLILDGLVDRYGGVSMKYYS